METKNITQSNKLIAEFMGRCGKVNKHLYWVNIPSVKWVTVEQMQFHTSWDWIIPVVEKIRQLVPESEFKYRFSYGFDSFDKLAVWVACVEFIEWYNNH